jgi:hypothetical protein
MAAIGIDKAAARNLEKPAEDGHEHAGVVAVAELVVDAFEEKIRPVGAHRDHAHEADGARHEERGRHAMTRHVAHAHEQARLVHEEGVEEIAPYAGGGLP